MKILMLCRDFTQLNGVSMYLYTLGKEMVSLGHDVTIRSKRGGITTKKAEEAGIEVLEIIDRTRKFDIVHSNQKYDLKYLDFYTGPIVHTIHSEYNSERPPIDGRIKQFIAIRPKIDRMWKKGSKIIYNPVDLSRFKPFDTKPKEELVLFVGVIDGVRQEAIRVLVDSGVKCRFVGKKHDDIPLGSNEWFDETWDIEEHMRDATVTAGILLGRTTIEGWACGIPGIIYEMSFGKTTRGKISKVEKHDPPKDMSLYDSKLVTKQILNIYEK